MTAKEFFSYARKAGSAMERHIRALERLRSTPDTTPNPGSKRPTEDAALRMALLEDSLTEEIARLQVLETRLAEVLKAIPDARDRLLLTQYYLFGKDIDELGDIINCSHRTTCNLLCRALSRVSLPEDLRKARSWEDIQPPTQPDP